MEEMDRETVITRRMADELDDGALLALVRRHAGLLGERFPKRAEDLYAPEITDLPRLLRRLYRMDPERFREMTAEQCRRDYMAGMLWAAVLLSEGETLPEESLRRLERTLPKALVREVGAMSSSVDSALLWEVSAPARQLWTGQWLEEHGQSDRCHLLSRALALRAEWLRVSHTDSAAQLYTLGWTPLDVMLAYLTGAVSSTYYAPVDPDCAADAAARDRETAVRLMDPDSYEVFFEGHFHPSCYMEMAKAWTELLYLHGGWTDTAPLERGHRLKKMAAFYSSTLERLQDPLWAQRELEQELTAVGLLPAEAAPDWDSPRLAKKQRLALTKALVCRYLWRLDTLRAALAASERPETFTGLLWGAYREDRLVQAFLLDGRGQARGEDGEALALPPEDRVGLAVPSELTREQLGLWKKRLKEAKPLIRQLSLPAEAPDFGAFADAVTKNITVFTVSGKWGMDMPRQPSHCRADLLDPLHGYGARIWFERAWSGSEYACDEVRIHGVDFYRMDGALFGDCLPRRAVVAPAELPKRFRVLAGAAFRQMAGIK